MTNTYMDQLQKLSVEYHDAMFLRSLAKTLLAENTEKNLEDVSTLNSIADRILEETSYEWDLVSEFSPTPGSYVATYADGSGSDVFLIDDNLDIYDYDSNQISEICPTEYSFISRLPEKFKLWFQIQGN